MSGREGVSIKQGKKSALTLEVATATAQISPCFGDCEIRKYTYKDATNIDQDIGGGASRKLKPSASQAAEIKKKIDGLTKVTSSGCAAKGCVCVEAAKQPQGYPKAGKPRTKRFKISDPDKGGDISFDVERTFEIYSGYCDDDDFV
jgi:hypothetical protein